jgi:hypothetical protein
LWLVKADSVLDRAARVARGEHDAARDYSEYVAIVDEHSRWQPTESAAVTYVVVVRQCECV